QIVAHVVVDVRGPVGFFAFGRRPADLGKFLLVARLTPVKVDRLVLRGGHEPRGRIVGYPILGPLFQRRDEGLLGDVLGLADVARDTGQRRDKSGGLHPPDCLDRRAHWPKTCNTCASPSQPGHRSRWSLTKRADHSTASSLLRTS